MLWLYVQAPFATFRHFTAGSFRPTAPFITPSAAYGLLLNLAGIDMRRDDGKSAMTLIRTGLPRVELALGSLGEPGRHGLYQQLHNYPVGSSGAEHAEACKGNKYNITPARRALLSDLRVCLGVRGNTDLEQQVRDGLRGAGPPRYGLPFLGDSNFLPDRIEPLDAPRAARWWLPVTRVAEDGAAPGDIARLTLTIDRADLSRTKSALFRPADHPSESVPPEAWIEVAY